jgi:N-acylneuraminate cytidylyltransferase
VIAIIPARGGSKRIHRKNIKNFHGKPVLERTIKILLGSGIFMDVFVSTEDNEIAEVATSNGARVLFRNQNLADDYTNTVDVISSAVQQLKNDSLLHTEYICCVYPVNPMLSTDRIIEGLSILKNSNLDYVFTAKKYESNPARALSQDENGLSRMINPDLLNTRSQDLPDLVHDAAMFYWGTSHAWIDKHPVLHGNSKFVILDKYETFDVDDENDWQMLEWIFQAKHNEIGNQNI